jgi:hypothetical protein
LNFAKKKNAFFEKQAILPRPAGTTNLFGTSESTMRFILVDESRVFLLLVKRTLDETKKEILYCRTVEKKTSKENTRRPTSL